MIELSSLDMPIDSLESSADILEYETPTTVAKPLPISLVAPLLALGVAACGGGGTDAAPSAPQAPLVVKPQSDAEAARFLLHTQFSVSDEQITALKTQGYEPWLDAEMSKAPSQTGIAWLSSRGFDQVNDQQYYNNTYPGQYMAWQQLLGTNDPVRKRFALALSEMFVVSLNALDFTWRSQGIAHYWDQLNSNAFGNFRTLLEDITLNPAMGFYLSTRGNQSENLRTGRRPDENYAREVMQLFTIGLNQLNPDGTVKRDAQGNTLPSYTTADVTNLARVFTGFDWDATGNVTTPAPGNPQWQVDNDRYTRQPMTQDATKWRYPRTNTTHSIPEATFLGVTIAANTNGTVALKTALDTLFNHVNTAPFFARQMIQRLVTSNPSPAYVQRVAAKFINNGAGARGDLRAVFKAIVMDDEARGATGLSSQTFGKVREPIVRLTQWARTFGATSVTGEWKIGDLSGASNGLAQNPLSSPSVFNFFRPGFVPAGTAIASNNLVAPEFQLVNEVTTAGYVNFMTGVIQNGLVNGDIRAVYTKELAVAADAAALVARVSLILTAGQISAANRTVIQTAIEAIRITGTNDDAVKLQRVLTTVLLVMASPEYLVQK